MWRKVRKEDIQVGLVIRLGYMTDTPFNGCVILDDCVHADPGYIKVARPQAYASASSRKQPYLYAEVFEMTRDYMCREDTDIEVYEGRNGSLFTMTAQ